MEKSEILILLQENPQKAFALIYELYYVDLCNASYRMLLDKLAAEDIVQEVLMEFWNKREQINVTSSVFAYLKRAVFNRSINYIKSKSKFTDDELALSTKESNEYSIEDQMIKDELQAKLSKVIESLPEKCRFAFSLSRYEEKTYAEIAEIMEISVKTVENQISKALRILRTSMLVNG
jgi:RNA polymerase sigma-70 factor, ECF subfamily